MSESLAATWDESLVQHRTWMRSLVRGRLGDGDHVEDVLSEVLVDALRIRATSSAIEKPQAWLYRLTIRKVLQYRRKQGRRRNLVKRWAERADVREEDTSLGTPLEILLGVETQTHVRRVLHRMPGRDADLLVLKYVQDWSYQQISESLDMAQTQLAHRLRAARQRFRKLLMEFLLDSIVMAGHGVRAEQELIEVEVENGETNVVPINTLIIDKHGLSDRRL